MVLCVLCVIWCCDWVMNKLLGIGFGFSGDKKKEGSSRSLLL